MWNGGFELFGSHFFENVRNLLILGNIVPDVFFQLVQRIPISSGESGVRLPHRPQKVSSKRAGLFCYAGNFVTFLMACVYILYSRHLDRYYIGSSSQTPEERLQKHLLHHRGFTGRAKDWVLVYTEIYNAKSDAYRRERLLKSWKSRKQIEELIKGGC